MSSMGGGGGIAHCKVLLVFVWRYNIFYFFPNSIVLSLCTGWLDTVGECVKYTQPSSKISDN